jgi:hypothetical protein
MWFEPSLIAGVFSEGFYVRRTLERILLSTIDRLFLENDLDPKRVAGILETTHNSSSRNLIDIIIQCAEIDGDRARVILRGQLIRIYEIPFSKETLAKIEAV